MTTIDASEGDETTSTVPPVVAVVVTCNPGDWFDETLTSLRDQDYPNLSVLVIDAGSIEDPLPRIAEALPHAYVRRLTRNPGFAAAANRALRIVQGSSHFVLCHDDVALAPDAVRKMVEEAFRQNAGIVAPKQVSWDNPKILVAMGGTADRSAALVPAIEPGEYDQGQHDTPHDVFIATGGAMLVRTDLFESLGGFDAAMTMYGEDIDLSWRAQLVGARIVAAPSAVVRHLEAGSKGLRAALPMTSDDEDDDETTPLVDEFVLRRRHRLRTALKVRRRTGLPITILQLAALSMAETVYSIFASKTGHASALFASWSWNAAHWRELLKARRQLRSIRSVTDHAIGERLGSTRSRLEGSVRREWEIRRERLQREGWGGRDVVGVVRNLTFAVWATVAVIWLIGTRELFNASSLPEVGSFMPFPDSPIESLRTFVGVVPSEGFGVPSVASPAHLVATGLGFLFGGAAGVAQKVLVLATLPLGVWGARRLTRPLGSTRARLTATAAYAAVPLPYAALGLGHLDALMAYAAAPWILHRLLRAHATSPYVSRRASDRFRIQFHRKRQADDDESLALDVSAPTGAASTMSDASAMLSQLGQQSAPVTVTAAPDTGRSLVMFVILRRIFPLALLLATAGAFAPQLVSASVAAGVLIVVASLVAGVTKGELAERVLLLVTVVFGGAIAVALLYPSVHDSSLGLAAFFQTAGNAAASNFVHVLAFDTGGPVGSLLSLGLVVAGVPALLVGAGWRFQLAVKLWFIVIGLALLTWASANDWLGPVRLDAQVVLALAGAAAALNAGVSAHALTEDLRRYDFGWRQSLPVLAVLGVLLAFVPVASGAGNGSWQLPQLSSADLLSSIEQGDKPGSFRVLWLGAPDAMPGGARHIDDDLGAAVSVDASIPTGPAEPVTGGIAENEIDKAVRAARTADTVQLGHMLAPYNIRYVVVPRATGSYSTTHLDVPPPSDLQEALRSQLDLSLFEPEPSLTVFENSAWIPLRSSLTPEATLAARDLNTQTSAYQGLDTSRITPVLEPAGSATWRGNVNSGEIFVGEAASESWRLSVAGERAARQPAFGWASSFSAPGGGPAVLTYRAPTSILVLQGLVVGAWLLIAFLTFRFRVRRGRYT